MRNLVEISAATLSAIKSMLFTNDGGVDLSPIVTDLTIGDDNRDLTAINTALVFRGAVPEIDKATRFGQDYKSLVQYTFISYSLIRDRVTAHRRKISEFDEAKNGMFSKDDEGYKVTFSLGEWLEKPVEPDEPISNIMKRWKKEDDE